MGALPFQRNHACGRARLVASFRLCTRRVTKFSVGIMPPDQFRRGLWFLPACRCYLVLKRFAWLDPHSQSFTLFGGANNEGKNFSPTGGEVGCVIILEAMKERDLTFP